MNYQEEKLGKKSHLQLQKKKTKQKPHSKILPRNKFNQRDENLYTEKYDIDERD